MRIGSLCSGYGGLEMSTTAVLGGTVAWHCEVDAAASHVLKTHAPDVPNHGSIVDLDWSDVEPVDLLDMGVPCQPFSAAGRQRAQDDHRYLWPHARIAVQRLRPRGVVFENVRNLISIRGGEIWRTILSDLREDGYAVRWLTIGACAVGAPHHRHRVFALGVRHPRPGGAVRLEVRECDTHRPLLPTAQARDGSNGRGQPTPESAAARWASGRRNLDDAVALLPTPVARDGSTRNEGSAEYWAARDAARGGKGKPLGAAVRLLPPPRAANATGGAGRIERLEGRTEGVDLRTAVVHGRWAQFAPAVAHWAYLTGTTVPEPTEYGPRGGLRLAPGLSEWMMGLPAGHLTDHVGRSDALRLAGNGVCPQQGERALRLLLESF